MRKMDQLREGSFGCQVRMPLGMPMNCSGFKAAGTSLGGLGILGVLDPGAPAEEEVEAPEDAGATDDGWLGGSMLSADRQDAGV